VSAAIVERLLSNHEFQGVRIINAVEIPWTFFRCRILTCLRLETGIHQFPYRHCWDYFCSLVFFLQFVLVLTNQLPYQLLYYDGCTMEVTVWHAPLHCDMCVRIQTNKKPPDLLVLRGIG
jgi:hypothetical protein